MRTWRLKVTEWRDSDWQSWAVTLGNSRPLRPSTRRWMKWEDCMRRFCSATGVGDWKSHAASKERWMEDAQAFVAWMLQSE